MSFIRRTLMWNDLGSQKNKIKNEYLTFTSLQDGSTFYVFKRNNPTITRNVELQYSLDEGKTWNVYTLPDAGANGDSITLNKGSKIILKGNNPEGFNECYRQGTSNVNKLAFYLNGTGGLNVEGNAFSLIYNDDFKNRAEKPTEGTFGRLFQNNTAIKEVNIFIGDGDYTFIDCSSLTSIIIPDSVTSIGASAFLECTSLDSIIIPDSVTSIGASAFSSCTSLDSIIIPDSVTSIGNYAFNGCTSLTSITIPSSVTSVMEGAFQDCSALTSVTIQEGVTSIGMYAFYSCTSLTSITIPSSVTSIGNYAFYSCTSLTSVYCLPMAPPTLANDRAFNGNASTRKIYVPSASVSAYKAATNWSAYADYIEAL